MQHYTTIEQSKKLVELGLNPDTADMFYNEKPDEYCSKDIVDTKYPMVIREGQKHYLKEYGVPCWSLGALINLIPSTINNGGETFILGICKDDIYHVCYKSHYHLDEIWFSKENLLDAAFEMVCWLLKNGYIEKGE